MLLEREWVAQLLRSFPRPFVIDSIREVLDDLRATPACNGGGIPDLARIDQMITERLLDSERDRLRSVVNATGIILHTNLGRAVLPQAAVDALSALNRCCNLQIDLETGARGKRNYVTERLICRLTGAEAAMVVNNNAAATLLVLAATCAGKEVVISRGQLIEIGGSFRLPDCIRQSGATMVEVGTTNKTHVRDYEAAISERTGTLLRVNPSNYRVVGFTKEVPVGDLVEVKKRFVQEEGRERFLVIDDLGCGALVDLREFGLPDEPTVQASIAAGADLVLFSGDKLIGGPQAGIIAGRRDIISRIKKHPLTRMLRVGKMTDLVLEHTLRLFLDPATLVEKNPTLRMLSAKPEYLLVRAEQLAEAIRRMDNQAAVDVIQGSSATGGGTLPATEIPTWLISVKLPAMSAVGLLAKMRKNEPPVIARIEEDHVVIDVRTLLDGEDEVVAAVFRR